MADVSNIINNIASTPSVDPLLSDEKNIDALFSSEKYLLNLLVIIRGSNIEDQDKLHLRDLVLEFAQITNPDTKVVVKQHIIKELKNQPVVLNSALKIISPIGANSQVLPATNTKEPEIKTPVTPMPSIGHSRLNPVFKTVDHKVAPPPKIVDQAPSTMINDVKDPVTTSPIIKASNTKETVVTPEVATIPLNVSVPVQATAKVEMPPHVPNPVERIGEIKRLVNSKVGNPINLIDSNNNIGLEYMNALLDAMKKSSGSSQAGELDLAMVRLEKAFQDVLNHLGVVGLEIIPEKNVPEPKEPNPEIEPQKAKVEKVAVPDPVNVKVITDTETKMGLKEIPSLAKYNVTDVLPIKTMANDLSAIKEVPQQQIKNQSTGIVQGAEENFLDTTLVTTNKSSLISSLASKLFEKTPTTNINVEPTKIQPKNEPLLKNIPTVAVKLAEPIIKTAEPIIKPVVDVPQDVPKVEPLKPVATNTTLPEKIIAFESKMKEQEAKDKMPVTDLNAPEVTAGLSQLMSEWKLFKSSGFLGTGPNGLEHPLYLKLKMMPMASVISGRFEGANPEIKQSITDYMNGWRYEQGLIHEMGETFEHYLRRVILLILERQKENSKA